MAHISWPWLLHRDLARRRQRGDTLEEVAGKEAEVTSERGRTMQATAQPLRDAGSKNQFTELVRGIMAGIDLRSQHHP